MITRGQPHLIPGIDVSHHQRKIDWDAVKASGVCWAVIKATEGVGYIDPQAERNGYECARVGIPHTYYHFARPSPEIGDAEAEAGWFLETTRERLVPPALPRQVLDLEKDKYDLSVEDLTTWVVAFLRKLQGGVLYSYPHFSKEQLGKGYGLENYPLWIAHYTRKDQPRYNTAIWTPEQVLAWQYSSHGRVPGIDHDVDLNWALPGWLDGISEAELPVFNRKGKVTDHFSWKECRSRDGVDVPAEYRDNCIKVCQNMEVFRAEAGGKPVVFECLYRSPDFNRRAGGRPKSQHLIANGCDFYPPEGMTTAEAFALIEKLVSAGKMEDGGLHAYARAVHYDRRGKRARW